VSARRFLEVDDLTPAEFAAVLDTAEKGKADPSDIPQLLAGQGVVLLFEKPSVRTRASTEMAVVSLGGHPIYVRPEEVGLGVRESVADVARTFAGFCSVLAARVFDHATLEEMASVIDIPVVNLLSDRAHPTQAVADFLTLRELLGTLEGRRLAYIGDGNNVTASLAFASALSGVDFAVASPPGYELDDLTVERVRNLGGSIELGHDPYDAVAGADAVYTDVWTSMGQEEESAMRRAAFAGFTVDDELLRCAHTDAWFLHCLPAHRGEEVAASVIDGPRSAVWQQAANRMHAARAVIAHLVGSGAR
jgi:ornithine carbamoyltransferase